MFVKCEGKYLNVSEGEFLNDQNKPVKFYRLSCLPAPEFDPIVFPCTADAAALPSALGLPKFADVVLKVEIYETRNSGVKVRVVDVEA